MILNAGTDAGDVVLFDPSALPEDFDAVIKGDPILHIERLHKEGRLIWFDTHSDGDYQLAIFEGGELPAYLQMYVESKTEISHFHTPSGTLHFTGIEYIFRQDDSFLRNYPHMGEMAQVKAGIHAATLYTLGYPEEFEDDLLAQKLTPEEQAARKRNNVFVPIGCLTFVATVLTFFFLPIATWAKFALLPCICVWFSIIRFLKSPASLAADKTAKKVTDDYPGFALIIHSTIASGRSV